MYFKKFDKIFYDFEINGKRDLLIVTDITRNVRFRKEVLANITAYDLYDIKDGETPEIIAEKIYGNAKYHWIIMLVNDRYDHINDFPLAQYELEQYVKEKYGTNNLNKIHHYEDINGNIVSNPNIDYNGVSQLTYPVSNAEYEEKVNESKRTIKIVSISLINTILKNFSQI
jgi:hypothetical protein